MHVKLSMLPWCNYIVMQQHITKIKNIVGRLGIVYLFVTFKVAKKKSTLRIVLKLSKWLCDYAQYCVFFLDLSTNLKVTSIFFDGSNCQFSKLGLLVMSTSPQPTSDLVLAKFSFFQFFLNTEPNHSLKIWTF